MHPPNFFLIRSVVSPLGAIENLWENAPNTDRTAPPRPISKFHVYRDNVSPLWGEKPIFGSLNKNNTGMAALRAGLLVTKIKIGLGCLLCHPATKQIGPILQLPEPTRSTIEYFA